MVFLECPARDSNPGEGLSWVPALNKFLDIPKHELYNGGSGGIIFIPLKYTGEVKQTQQRSCYTDDNGEESPVMDVKLFPNH